MFVTRDREKFLNAVIFFLQNTQHCHTLKLFKLLYALDFEHFRQTGTTVTGLRYKAWENGPVPDELWRELKAGGHKDFLATLSMVPKKDELTGVLLRREMKPKVAFDRRLFSRREMEIMERVAEIFRDARGEDMRDFSHDPKLPWRRVYAGGEGNNKIIDPELSFESPPLIHDVPTIDRHEHELRKELFKGIA